MLAQKQPPFKECVIAHWSSDSAPTIQRGSSLLPKPWIQEARGKMQEARKTSAPIAHYEDLLVYRKSYELALQVHRISLQFPEFERYELGRQLREASKSV